MIHLRDFQQGAEEDGRKALCGEPASSVPTTSGCIEWWCQRAVLCPLCWDAWLGTLEVVAKIPDMGPT